MKFLKTFIPGLIVIEPKVFIDERGYFFESYNDKAFLENVGDVKFVQDNESKSTYGVLRGLHFQKEPYAQAKLLRCIEGNVLDVAVDVRPQSVTFGKHFSIVLSGENKKQLFIPKGFAHGFVVLSKEATIAYKVDDFYAPEYDSGIIWNDRELNIDWQVSESELVISKKDKLLKPLSTLFE